VLPGGIVRGALVQGDVAQRALRGGGEGRLVGRQVGGELLVEQLLADVEVGGAVGRGTGEIGLAERAAGEAPGQLADALLVLRGEGRDEDERLDRGLSLAAAEMTAPP
jgi:hypothetical protein